MTDKKPAEWALKMAQSIVVDECAVGFDPECELRVARRLEARFRPVMEAWDAWDSTVPVKSWQRIADAVKEFRTG